MRVRRSAPIIAVLAQPDNQELGERADAYNRLIKDMAVLPVAAAPAQGRTGAGYVLTLDGEWKQGRLDRFGHTLGFAPERYIVPGMSGSPIVSAAGAAIPPAGCMPSWCWSSHSPRCMVSLCAACANSPLTAIVILNEFALGVPRPAVKDR